MYCLRVYWSWLVGEFLLAGRDRFCGIRAPGLAVSVDLGYVFSVWVGSMPCDSVLLRADLSRDRFDMMQDELLGVRYLLLDEIRMYCDAVT